MLVVHTADIHLDHCFDSQGFPQAVGARRRKRQREALAGVLRHAWDRQADAVLIAGDLMETENLSRETLSFVREQFARIVPVPVLIAPGNKDACTPGCPYLAEEWPDNVHIFRESEWRTWQSPEVPLVVHGLGNTGAAIPPGTVTGLHVPRDEKTHIALVHAGETAHLPEGYDPVAPFTLSDMLQPGWTISPSATSTAACACRKAPGLPAWYAGPPEPMGFEEPGPGHFLEIIIEADGRGGKAVSVTRRQASNRLHVSLELDCTGLPDGEPWRDGQVAPAGSGHGAAPAPCAAGPCFKRTLERASRCSCTASGGLEALVVEDRSTLDDDHAAWSGEDTALGDFVRRMAAEIEDGPTPGDRLRLERARATSGVRLSGPPVAP
jgi:hypothetical protein